MQANVEYLASEIRYDLAPLEFCPCGRSKQKDRRERRRDKCI